MDKFLEQNKSKKKQLNMEFDNMKYIIFQYHYDILKIKNKINQNQFKINCLNVKMNNCTLKNVDCMEVFKKIPDIKRIRKPCKYGFTRCSRIKILMGKFR